MPYSPVEDKPSTLVEAVLFAHHWYRDSGFFAFVHGWGMARDEDWPESALTEHGTLYQPHLVKWAKEHA